MSEEQEFLTDREFEIKTRQAQAEALKKLREPFPDSQISKLPKPTKKQTEEVAADYTKGIRCDLCGGWHHPKVVHLDYVGHAALTNRLLDVDPFWAWEPLAIHEGLPKVDAAGGMWIKLTVCGMTRLGYGDAEGKDKGNAVKERIGDAIRNAAMRFGAALDLWSKADLHAEDGIEESKLNQFVLGIENAADIDTLKDVYLACAAVCEKDKEAMATLSIAKAKRYRELKVETK